MRAALAAPALITCPKLLEAGWQSRDSNYNQNIAAGGSLGLQTNLGSFFSLDNTLADATGSVTNLTNNNTVTFVTTAATSGPSANTNCANFVTASSQYLSHADATGINVAAIDFSLQVWFRSTASTMFFASKATGGFGSREYQLSYGFGTGSSNPITFDANNGTTLTSGNVTNSAWHHMVITRNNATNAQIMYIDGSSFASNTGSSDPAGTSQLNIGADPAPGTFWGGQLCMFGTWRNRILSAGDVTLLYNSGNGLSYAAMA